MARSGLLSGSESRLWAWERLTVVWVVWVHGPHTGSMVDRVHLLSPLLGTWCTRCMERHHGALGLLCSRMPTMRSPRGVRRLVDGDAMASLGLLGASVGTGGY